jgi:homoserine/homoserine lactone efflux protein
MWRSRGKMAIAEDRENQVAIKPYQLVAQGLVTAITNPKSWAFMISLLPAF